MEQGYTSGLQYVTADTDLYVEDSHELTRRGKRIPVVPSVSDITVVTALY